MMSKTNHDEVVDQLDQFYSQAKRQILQNQSAITGLFPTNSAETSSASIKTSLWAASSIFALYLAYSKRVDNDKGKAHDLGQSVVKCMRGILFAWMRQSERVESFKANQSPQHALHLKFDLHSGLANDHDYPHLQIDVVSLYLIFLANFIASGLDIIYCMDEVTFIQNLVYYVERAYRTPDYGNWEPAERNQPFGSAPMNSDPPSWAPGNQANQAPPAHSGHQSQPFGHGGEPIDYSNLVGSQKHGQWSNQTACQANTFACHYNAATDAAAMAANNQEDCRDGRSLEIHATSIGMAKSALEAINGCNLFGGKGANWSIIYSDIDAHSRNRSIFETLLPRESRSKNTDSYLLATISWPCFATHEPTLYQATKAKILRRLKGRYGLKRFLRDPYGTVLDMGHIPVGSPNSPLGDAQSAGVGQVKESSFSSTNTSISSVSSLLSGDPPKSKQRKSSYFQRKNILSRASSGGYTIVEQPNVMNATNLQKPTTVGGPARHELLQHMDSATKMSKRFEHIESEWPLFVCFLIIDGIFKQDVDQIMEYEKLLYERLLKVDSRHGDYLMPKYYYVPLELITSEKCHPDSVERLASLEGSSPDQLYLTGQSILLITRLLLAGLVHPNELDPLRRHMPSHDRPKRIGRYSSFQATSSDLVVQTVLIAESIRLQAMMANYGIQTQTPLEVEPVQIWSSAQLVKVYEYLGVNEKLCLKGRPSRPIGALGTSKLYRICGQTILCYPLIFEVSDFYLAQDMLLLIDDIQNELNFIGRYWRMSGRPTVCIIIREEHLKDVHFRDLLDLLVQFKNGQLKKSGLRIKTGRLQNLISSSCIEHLDFLHLLPHEHLPQFKSFRQLVESPKQSLLLNASSRATSFMASGSPAATTAKAKSMLIHPNRKQSDNSKPMGSNKGGRRTLCSASSHNLQAIEELNASSSLSGDFNMSASGSSDDSLFNETEHHHQQQLDFNASNGANLLHHRQFSLETDLEHSYSITPSSAIDYYEAYKEAPTWPTIVEHLRNCQELVGQSQLLAILWEREGAKYCIDELSVEDRLERLSQQACQLRNWSVVRYCSSVLCRSVESLSPWLTSILVNGKQISLGTGPNEKIVNNPLTPTEIHKLIYSTTINTKNPCDAVLQQEIALYIGRLISTRPDYFDGILTIRVTNFMSAMRSYLAIKTNERKLSQQRHFVRQQKQQQQQQQQQELNPEINIACEEQSQLLPPASPQQLLLDLRMKPAQPADGQTERPSFELGPSTSQATPQIKIEVQPPTPSTSTNPPVSSFESSTSTRLYRSGHRHRSTGQALLVAKPLESLSPSDVRKLLVKVLNDDESMPISDRRQITGELCRVPKDFYDKVWSLLSCTNVGIIIGGRMLRSVPILTSMTQDDLNFALKVESMLSGIECPKLRQVNVELLMALHVILERNPEIRFETDPLDLDKIINLSLDKFRTDFQRQDFGLREFYTLSTQTTTLYVARTVFDCLLPIKYKGRAECRLS